MVETIVHLLRLVLGISGLVLIGTAFRHLNEAYDGPSPFSRKGMFKFDLPKQYFTPKGHKLFSIGCYLAGSIGVITILYMLYQAYGG